MLVYSALLAQYNVCTQCLQTLFNSIYRAPAQWLPLFFQAHANLKLVSDQSESDRSETNLRFDLARKTKQIYCILMAADHTLGTKRGPPNTLYWHHPNLKLGFRPV